MAITAENVTRRGAGIVAAREGFLRSFWSAQVNALSRWVRYRVEITEV